MDWTNKTFASIILNAETLFTNTLNPNINLMIFT